jgi:1-piperideine-2-carboxylate/1-pyrroline-2-carboxylate reductase [NAD(P)H]
MMELLDAQRTAGRLPWPALLRELSAVLHDPVACVPPRLVQPLPGGGSLFVMPAFDADVAITKLITFTPANTGTKTPTIQGDVVVFDVKSGTRRLVLDGPTVTACRTAAVSLLAAQWLAPNTEGPLLIVGAGAQGHAHLEAFAATLSLREVLVHSRSEASAHVLALRARQIGLQASVVSDANSALEKCPLVVTCTPAAQVVLHGTPRDDAFIAAVGAFTPKMIELAPALTQHLARTGRIVVDTRDADHEAGDLLQAGIDVTQVPSLKDVDPSTDARRGPVLFKSCGWAGWDLAAARCAMRVVADH